MNALTAAEREQMLRLLDSPQFVDAAPAQIHAALLDQGVYAGSIATMYRILREHRQVKERRRLARHPARARPELVTDRPHTFRKTVATILDTGPPRVTPDELTPRTT